MTKQHHMTTRRRTAAGAMVGAVALLAAWAITTGGTLATAAPPSGSEGVGQRAGRRAARRSRARGSGSERRSARPGHRREDAQGTAGRRREAKGQRAMVAASSGMATPASACRWSRPAMPSTLPTAWTCPGPASEMRTDLRGGHHGRAGQGLAEAGQQQGWRGLRGGRCSMTRTRRRVTPLDATGRA